MVRVLQTRYVYVRGNLNGSDSTNQVCLCPRGSEWFGFYKPGMSMSTIDDTQTTPPAAPSLDFRGLEGKGQGSPTRRFYVVSTGILRGSVPGYG